MDNDPEKTNENRKREKKKGNNNNNKKRRGMKVKHTRARKGRNNGWTAQSEGALQSSDTLFFLLPNKQTNNKQTKAHKPYQKFRSFRHCSLSIFRKSNVITNTNSCNARTLCMDSRMQRRGRRRGRKRRRRSRMKKKRKKKAG